MAGEDQDRPSEVPGNQANSRRIKARLHLWIPTQYLGHSGKIDVKPALLFSWSHMAAQSSQKITAWISCVVA